MEAVIVGEKRLVKNISFSPHDACNFGTCPHCGGGINDYASVNECQFCKGSIAWDLSRLTQEERGREEKERKQQKEEAIKESKIAPCPFCGSIISPPRLSYINETKTACALQIDCHMCGISFENASLKTDVESINKCSEELIAKWNKRA